MFRGKTRLRAPALLIAALTALLVFAAAAAAETRTGETTSTVPLGEAASPETTLVRSSASYETAGGSVGFDITTAAAPDPENEEVEMLAALFTARSECNIFALTSGGFAPPLLEIVSSYAEPTSAEVLVITGIAEPPSVFLPAAKTVSGTTTTLAITSGQLANQSFNCALVETLEEEGSSFMIFPISAPVIPPPAPPAPPAPAPAPGPPVLSIAKAKPLKLKVGKSRTVKVKLTNTGATATAQGSLRMKPTKGVLVTPETQKLPALAPGASWTVSVRVKLTEKAKPKATLSLTGTASGVTGKGSLVVKLTE
jgi:hypothetical protein